MDLAVIMASVPGLVVDTRHGAAIVSSADTNAATLLTRLAARDARPADPADLAERRLAWLGDLGTHSADLRGCAADQPGLVVPRTASPGASGMDRSRVGGVRTRAAREVLPPHHVRP